MPEEDSILSKPPHLHPNFSKILFLLFALVLLPFQLELQASKNAEENPTENPARSFPEKIHQAYGYVMEGKFDQSSSLFEKLLKTNPDEFVVYDAYAQACEFGGNYLRAIMIYKRWIARDRLLTREETKEASKKIEELKKKQEFSETMLHAESWEWAPTYQTDKFLVKTNIPEKYHAQVLDQLRQIIRSEKDILQNIFGYPANQRDWMKVFITGRREDYFQLLRELKKSKPAPVFPTASYFHETKTIAILFDGLIDQTVLTHEVAHYLIQNHYVQIPSPILNEGLAEYLAYKLAKESAKSRLRENLGYMNWLYDQGLWESALEDPSKNPYPGDRVFYLRAWTLIYFLLEGGGPFFNTFFKKYLDHERNNLVNNFETSWKFFQQNLTKEQFRNLNNKWQEFTLNLTYEKI